MICYEASKTIGGLVLKSFFGWKRAGHENIPATGPLILCSSHISWWDPVAIGFACPRVVRFMAKEELFRNKLFGAYLKALGAFPVKRGKPDRAALRTAFGLLAAGEVLGVFPEGTRSTDGNLGKIEPGTAVIAAKTGAPVLPAAAIGKYRVGGRPAIRFGKPFMIPREMGSSRDGILDACQLIMSKVAQLREQEYLE